MVSKEFFTSQEWQTLEFAPLWVFTAVAGADNINNKETQALTKELHEAYLYKEPLVRDILKSVADNFNKLMPIFQQDKREIYTGLKEAAKILAIKVTSEQALNFKKDMLLIAQVVAKASGGSIFGLGDKISKQEEEAMQNIREAFGGDF